MNLNLDPDQVQLEREKNHDLPSSADLRQPSLLHFKHYIYFDRIEFARRPMNAKR